MILSDTNSSLCNYKAKYRQFQLLLQLLSVYILCIYILDFFFCLLFVLPDSLLAQCVWGGCWDAHKLHQPAAPVLAASVWCPGTGVQHKQHTVCKRCSHSKRVTVWLRHKLSGKSNTASDQYAVVGCTLIFVFSCDWTVCEVRHTVQC